jgi:uncharacterized protein (DUF779 family)
MRNEATLVATDAALAAISSLVAERGGVMFFQSGGCCDGSLPICLDAGELAVGDDDVLAGRIQGCPLYVDHRLWELYRRGQLILDVDEGEPEGFSLPAGVGGHFVVRTRLWEPAPMLLREPD